MNKNNMKKSIFYKNNIKKLNNTNITLNIILCSSSILFFGFNIWALAAAYIGSDILLSILNNSVTKYNIKKTLKSNNIEDLRNLIEENAKYYCSKGSKSEEFKFYTDLIDKLEIEVNKKIEKDNKLSIEQEEKDNLISAKERREIERIKNTIYIFFEFYNNLNNNEKTDYIEINEIFKEIKELLDEKPKACSVIDSFFSIYTNDLINLTKTLDSISIIRKKTYEESIYRLITEFTIYLNRVKDKIKNYDSGTIEIDINFLLNELKNINSEENNKITNNKCIKKEKDNENN